MESFTERSFKMIFDKRSVSDFLAHNPKGAQGIEKLCYIKTPFILIYPSI